MLARNSTAPLESSNGLRSNSQARCGRGRLETRDGRIDPGERSRELPIESVDM